MISALKGVLTVSQSVSQSMVFQDGGRLIPGKGEISRLGGEQVGVRCGPQTKKSGCSSEGVFPLFWPIQFLFNFDWRVASNVTIKIRGGLLDLYKCMTRMPS